MQTTKQAPSVLVVEDNDEDYFILQRVLRKRKMAYSLLRCTKGEEALDVLYHRGAFATQALHDSWQPSLILLDLNIIGMDGRAVLSDIKNSQDERVKQIPVVVYTTSSNPQDIHYCYSHGANSYLLKPVIKETLGEQIQRLFDYWFQTVLLPEKDI